jgi:hypothetical protein
VDDERVVGRPWTAADRAAEEARQAAAREQAASMWKDAEPAPAKAPAPRRERVREGRVVRPRTAARTAARRTSSATRAGPDDDPDPPSRQELTRVIQARFAAIRAMGGGRG